MTQLLFKFLSLEIRWYSLAYISGILLGWLYCKKKLIKDKILSNLFDDFITYVIIGIILGGRLGYVLFYNLNYYLQNPIEIFMVWNGGMSFHGGVIGVIVGALIFSKKNKIKSVHFFRFSSFNSTYWNFFWKNCKFYKFRTLWKTNRGLPWSVQSLQ